MSDVVFRGTPNFSKSTACLGCKHAMIREGSDGKITIRCQQFNTIIRQHITKCNAFYAATEPWIHEYESIAWVLTTDVHGRKIGFRKLQNDEERLPHVGF